MINILCEMITIRHEKMLNAIYLYWIHNDTLAGNNSLNDHSNEPGINRQKSVISPVKLNLLDTVDLFLDSDSFYNCIPHFLSERSN